MAFRWSGSQRDPRAVERERAVGQACAQLASATSDGEIYRITASAIVRMIDVPCSVVIALDQIHEAQRPGLTDASNLARKEVFFVTARDLYGEVAEAYATRQLHDRFGPQALRWLSRQVAREGRVKASRLVPLTDDVAAHGALIVVAEDTLNDNVVSALSTLSSMCSIALSRRILEAAVAERTDRLTAANRALMAAQADLAVRERNQRLLFESHPHPMWVFDDTTLKFLAVNDAAIEQYGYTRDQFLSMRITDVGWPRDLVHFRAHRGDGADQKVTRETMHRLADGSFIDVEVTVQPLDFANSAVSLVLAQNVTQRKALEEELRHQALHDPLTGLANRALLSDRLKHALSWRNPRRCGVLLVDLDDFKNVNDSLGHTAGDMLLVELSQRIAGELRTADTAARLGGDEFAILIEDIADPREALDAARRILTTLRVPLELGGNRMSVTASIGVAVSGDSEGSAAEDLLRNADVAMYEAKEAGKCQCRLFTGDMYDRVLHNINTEVDLRGALDRDELFLEYQPIVTCKGEVVGVEALVRWRHPERGVVPPAEFIPVAEATGMILPITHWVLDEACRGVLSLQATTGRPLAVSVNISRQLLERSELVADVRDALRESGLEPWRLSLEVTETAVAADIVCARERLRELKALGVYLAIDDFGTGHSSLGQLEELPVDLVKIDRSLIARLGETEAASAVVRAVVELARAMDLRVISEGVETADQAVLVSTLAPRAYMQGYFYARPLSIEALVVLLREVEARKDRACDEDNGVGKTRMMIVDDNEDLRVVLERVFSDLVEFDVVATAANGEEAVRLAQQHSPDVVLMDAQMPVKDGISAARDIRELAPTTRVVMMSGGDGRLLDDEAEAVGDAYFVKGTRVSELVNMITRVVQSPPQPLSPRQPVPTRVIRKTSGTRG